MSKDNDKPFWWPLVEAAGMNPELWEPVREGDITKPEEMSLLSQGWTGTNRDDSTIGRTYSKYDPPRIRRKKRKMVTWRRCAHISITNVWFPSGEIEKGWIPLESQTSPYETVKQLPEGEMP